MKLRNSRTLVGFIFWLSHTNIKSLLQLYCRHYHLKITNVWSYDSIWRELMRKKSTFLVKNPTDRYTQKCWWHCKSVGPLRAWRETAREEKSGKESLDEKGPKLWEDENKWALSHKEKAQRSEARHLLASHHITSHWWWDMLSIVCHSPKERRYFLLALSFLSFRILFLA